MYLRSPVGVSLLSPVLPVFREAFGLTETDASLRFAPYFLPAVVLSPAIGMLADRYGRRPVLVPSLVRDGVFGAATARDEFGRTSAADVYAADDCAEKRHLLSDAPTRWPYGFAANRAGRAIGRTVAGTPAPGAAREAGFDPISTAITSITRAHYYPGWSRIVVHLLADERSGDVEA